MPEAYCKEASSRKEGFEKADSSRLVRLWLIHVDGAGIRASPTVTERITKLAIASEARREVLVQELVLRGIVVNSAADAIRGAVRLCVNRLDIGDKARISEDDRSRNCAHQYVQHRSVCAVAQPKVYLLRLCALIGALEQNPGVHPPSAPLTTCAPWLYPSTKILPLGQAST